MHMSIHLSVCLMVNDLWVKGLSPITDDDNHIVLQPITGRPDCQRDYINASYIHVCTS